MQVKDICTREVVTVGRDASVQQAAELMRTLHVGDLVVVEERGGARMPVGILTDRDVVLAVVADEIDPASVASGDVMSFELQTINESDSVLHAARAMAAAGVRRVPVVDDAGTLSGIIAVDDILAAASEIVGVLARITRRERQHEERTRV